VRLHYVTTTTLPLRWGGGNGAKPCGSWTTQAKGVLSPFVEGRLDGQVWQPQVSSQRHVDWHDIVLMTVAAEVLRPALYVCVLAVAEGWLEAVRASPDN
jgi:hypothetical protein